jgi:hypothetical protein
MRAVDLGDRQPQTVGVMILLDRSGSMKTISAAMEEQFAAFLAEQRGLAPDGMWLSLHQFDCEEGGLEYQVVYDRVPLAQVPDSLQLRPRGWTPLRDALCRFALEARRVIDDPADETERLLLVIVTDGDENRSRAHTWDEVRELMQGLESAQVETIWLGTTDAILQAQAEMPMAMASPGATVSYTADSAGVRHAYGGLRAATMGMRVGASSRQSVAHYTDDADATLEELILRMQRERKP